MRRRLRRRAQFQPLWCGRRVFDDGARARPDRIVGDRHVAACGRSHIRARADVQHEPDRLRGAGRRSEEHTSELQSLMRISYAVFCLKKKKNKMTQYIKPTIDSAINYNTYQTDIS